MSRILIIVAVVLALAAAVYLGCDTPVAPVTEKPAPAPIAWIANGNAPPVTEEYVTYAAKFDFVMHANGVWAGRQGAMDRIHKRNPNTRLGEHLPTCSTGPWIIREEGKDNYYGRLMAAIDGRWAVTTERDTASIWKNFPIFDFMDPSVRTDVIRVIADHARVDRVQWFMWDYFQEQYGHPSREDGVFGELDLDRDGIAHKEDPDERELMHKVFRWYVAEMRDALPDSVLLIPNGNMAMFHNDFAKLFDGIYIEQFPNWFFGGQGPLLHNALDPTFVAPGNGPRSLFHLTAPDRYINGLGFVLLGDVTPYHDWRALADTFSFVVPAFNQTGQPEWPAIFEGD